MSKNYLTHLPYKIIFVLCLFISVMLLSKLIAYYKTGADPKNILNIQKEIFTSHTPFVLWEKNDKLRGINPDEYTIEKIEKDYLMAWNLLNLSIKSKEYSSLKDYFADSILVQIQNSSQFNTSFDFEQVEIEHHILPTYFPYDRKMIAFDDNGVKIIKRAFKKNTSDLVYQREDVSDFKVIMMLQDGFWKIVELHKKITLDNQGEIFSSTKENHFEVNKNGFLLNGKPFKVKGINYYPQDAPWSLFWRNVDKHTLDADFDLIKSSGFNTVRIFIPYEEFGGAHVKREMLDKLSFLLESLKSKELYALITLFDFPKGFDWQHYTKADQHLRKIVEHCKSFDSVIAYDLKNEPDLDIVQYGNKVNDWLAFLLERFRKYAPNELLTIGWSDAAYINQFNEELDFLCFHYYKEEEDFEAVLLKVKNENPNKLIVLEEFGFPTYKSKVFPIHNTSIDQKDYVAEILNVIEKESIPYFIWTLHDFKELPNGTFSSRPWVKNPQKHFGLYDQNGEAKPVLSLFVKEKKEYKKESQFPSYIFTWALVILLIFLMLNFKRFLVYKFFKVK